MGFEIPQNEERKVAVTVPNETVRDALLREVFKNHNVRSVVCARDGAGFRVMVYYAIMDLPLQLSAMVSTIELIAVEVGGRAAGA